MNAPTSLQEISANDQVFVSESHEETAELGRCWGQALRPPLVILLSGELGMGKSVLARGLARGLGVPQEEPLSSPTFTLVNTYQGRCVVQHVDLYRLDSERDLQSIGLPDLLSADAVTLVEWGEKIRAWISTGLEVKIGDLGGSRRRISCRFFSASCNSC